MEAAIETYNEVLDDEEYLTSDQHIMIAEQLLSIKMDYDIIKKVRDLVELDIQIFVLIFILIK